MDVNDLTIEELEKEIENRKHRIKVLESPKMIENPDLTALRSFCSSIVDDVINGDWYDDNDYADYIYETAMSTFYGHGIWNWINKNT